MKLQKFGIVAFLLVGLVAGAFAFQGNAKVGEALEQGDYGAWKQAMTEDLTEERFEQMRERHALREERRADRMDEMDALIAQGYDVWKGQAPMADQISEEEFDTFVAMHEARKAGDHETADALAEELGFGLKGRRVHGPGQRGQGEMGKGLRCPGRLGCQCE